MRVWNIWRYLLFFTHSIISWWRAWKRPKRFETLHAHEGIEININNTSIVHICEMQDDPFDGWLYISQNHWDSLIETVSAVVFLWLFWFSTWYLNTYVSSRGGMLFKCRYCACKVRIILHVGMSQLFLKIHPLFFWEFPQNQARCSSKLSLLYSVIVLHFRGEHILQRKVGAASTDAELELPSAEVETDRIPVKVLSAGWRCVVSSLSGSSIDSDLCLCCRRWARCTSQTFYLSFPRFVPVIPRLFIIPRGSYCSQNYSKIMGTSLPMCCDEACLVRFSDNRVECAAHLVNNGLTVSGSSAIVEFDYFADYTRCKLDDESQFRDCKLPFELVKP